MHTLGQIRDFMESMGIPGRDLWELPDSTMRFPDGAHWRVEISGVERASTMAAIIDESHKRDIPIHRAIATVGGSTFLDMAELRDMAQMAHDEGIEIIMAIGHRKAWDVGSKEMSTWEGEMWGARLRGSDNVSYWLADMMRNLEAGIRGFLVYDEGVLSIVNRRKSGRIAWSQHVQSVFRRVASHPRRNTTGSQDDLGRLRCNSGLYGR